MQQLNQPEPVAVYARVSSQEQADNNSVDGQLHAIQTYIKRNDDRYIFDPSLVYADEGVSGGTHYTIRPQLHKLFKDIKQKKIQTVIVMRIDRLFRSLRFLLEFMDEVLAHGGKIVFLDFPELSNTIFSRAMIGVMGMLAEVEKQLNELRSTEGRMAAAAKGRWLGGKMIYGFDTDEHKYIIHYPQEAQIIKQMFNEFAQNDLCIPEFTMYWNTKKLQKHKKKTDRTFTQGGIVFRNKLMRSYLTNPAYIGKYYYGKKKTITDTMGRKKDKILRDYSQMTCIRVEPIINEDVFNTVQRKIKKLDQIEKNKQRNKDGEQEYLFTSKLICADCNKIYTGKLSSKNTPQYAHRKKKIKNKVVCRVSRSSISQGVLEEVVMSIITKLLKSPRKGVTEVLEKDITSMMKNKAGMEQDIKKQNVQIEKLEKKKTQTNWYAIENNLPNEQREQMIENIQIEIDQIKEQQKIIQNQLTVTETQKERIKALESVSQQYKNKLNNPSWETCKDLIQSFIPQISIDNNKLSIYLSIIRKEHDQSSEFLKEVNPENNNVNTKLGTNLKPHYQEDNEVLVLRNCVSGGHERT